MKTTVALIITLLLSGFGQFALAAAGPAAGEDAMARMHETMQQIRQTEDPERRAELLEAHLDEMHAVMRRMQRDLGELMRGVEEQKRQSRRLHDHRSKK